jgi:murein DD-endopeptidase MepM/ murein hydrolase activator NlpD
MKPSKLIFFLAIIIFLMISGTSKADQVSQLKSEIATGNQEIQALETEIKLYQNQLNNLKQEFSSLEAEIKRIDLTRKKLESDINLTEKKIVQAELNIKRLAIDIDYSNLKIGDNKDFIAEALRQIKYAEQNSLVDILAGYETLTEGLQKVTTLEKLHQDMIEHLNKLRKTKTNKENQKNEEEKTKAEMAFLIVSLADQKKIAEINQQQKETILTQTKNQESNYQQLLAERENRKKLLEAEIRQAEETLRVVIDPQSIPQPQKGVISWPVDKIRITQGFGITDFVRRNPQFYGNSGHNGVDFGGPIGTPVKASLDGQIWAVDDTDLVCPGASYGRWIVIKHPNNLSTLYAHLSLIKVIEGQTVKRGEIIGYIGNTGFSTGPHLHFTLIPTEAVKVTDGINELKSQSCPGAIFRIPIMPYANCLDPMDYF